MSSIAVGAEGPAAPVTRGRWAKAWPYLLYAARRIVQAVVVILLAYVITFVVISIVGANPISTQLHSPQAGHPPYHAV